MKIYQLTLKKKVENFCMSKGSTLEFKGGKHKWLGSDRPYYPNFGPYHQLNLVAELLHLRKANQETKEMFKVKVIEE